MQGYYLKVDTIAEVTQQLRNQGQNVVFTHGCFDILHAGHLHLLKTSKKKGETLIVGIESDIRIYTYKNPGRPIINQEERIQMLISNRFVDFVFMIDGKVPWSDAYYESLYKKLNPTVITYGGSHGQARKFELKKNQLKDINYEQIEEIPLETGSTSKIITKIRELN